MSSISTFDFNGNLFLKDNAALLYASEKGDRFYLDPTGETLIKIEGLIAKIWYFIQRLFFSTAHLALRDRVKEKISAVVTHLNQQVHKIGSSENKQALYTDFFLRMKGLSQNVFNRGEIAEEVVDLMEPALHKYKNELEQEKLGNDPEKIEIAQYQYDFSAVQFAQKLGVEFELLHEGSSGAYKCKDRFGKVQFVFKPADEDPYGDNTPKNSSRLWSQFTRLINLDVHPGFGKHQAHMAEVGACVVNYVAQLKMVPMTAMLKLTSEQFYGSEKTKEGSCQRWVEGKGVRLASEIITNDPAAQIESYLAEVAARHPTRSLTEIKEQFQKEVEKMAILDFAIGNLDRNWENLLFQELENGDVKIILIDHGWSFYQNHPISDPLCDKHQYAWKVLPQTQYPFSPEAKKIIVDLFAKKEIMYASLAKKEIIPGFEESKQKMMEDRLQVLRRYAEEGKTLLELAQVQRQQDFTNLGF